MRGVDKSNLEELIFKQAEELKNLREKVSQVQDVQEQVQQEIRRSLGPIGVIRYNAFDDVGSDLSFSVSILNREKNGIVLTSLYGREDSRIYAKPIVNGESQYKMTEEEKQAVSIAVQNAAK
ncbi:hypothetical protein EFBL_0747 [Effusibacillus lacus]|uniref:DUF4446 domain-containing protein n=2 Tax=Effusibacillus lacus TaxID=1348429 RepID=A0A292YJP8_9BACL|nr:hypothetical protein EFBL_0747 [Effusibacillus lacus]